LRGPMAASAAGAAERLPVPSLPERFSSIVRL
jgi:hypothetical protein